MEPVGGAIEAGLSSVTAATESAANVTTMVAKTSAAVSAAPIKAAEGTQAIENVVENAESAMPATAEAGQEAISQEAKLADSTEDALGASGSDAALNQLAGEPTEAGTVPAGDTDTNPDASPSQPVSESTELNTASAQGTSGITPEIQSDPLFQKTLDDERAAAQARGETPDEDKLSQNALDKFNQAKSLQAEQSELTPELQKIQQLEGKINSLVTENAELKVNISQINEMLVQMKDVLAILIPKAIAVEEDPKKRETLLVLLMKILGTIISSSAIEVGKDINPVKK
jgi:hypothetical protein